MELICKALPSPGLAIVLDGGQGVNGGISGSLGGSVIIRALGYPEEVLDGSSVVLVQPKPGRGPASTSQGVSP